MDLSTLMPQQRDIVTTLDRPLFVSAGAGSGKTFTLTRRILWALSPESGPYLTGLDQVLAITFTRDAAAEIRERVRAALIAEGMDREALTVDDAWISTIHGMCARILRAHALELGLDPEFGVLGDVDELMDRAVDNVLARGERGFEELFAWYRLSDEGAFGGTSVRQLVRRLLELASAAREGFDSLRIARGHVDLSAMRDAYQALLESGTGAGLQVAERALAAIDAFEAAPRTRADLVACLMACDAPRASKGFPKESVDWLKAEVADAFLNAYAACDRAALDQLLALARAVFEEYRALKQERSVLDNNDLLRLAYEALRDHDELRREYGGRFKLVMIDEFQDTDQQQVDLIGFLTGEGGRALCTVGDAQQSIYRFRGAEVEVFRCQQRAVADAAAPGRLINLVKNFRSHADILDYVACIFDDARGGIMPRFLNLAAHDGRQDGLAASVPRRQAFLIAGRKAEDRTAAVAEGIARRFRALADAGQPTGGMVLLLGAMARADVYAEAIRTVGLPCVISGGSVFAQQPEVKAIRALACALANPLDAEQGLVPLLQSPLFALGVQEFLALATAFDPATGETRRRNVEEGLLTDEDAPGFGPLPLLVRARAVLASALSRVGRDPLAAIARDVVNGSGWFVRLSAQGAQGKAVAANVLKALDALAEAEAEVGRSPRRIALAFDRFLAGKQAPGALNEETGDAVRIMTVHASKGLEFPVVAVAECYRIRANTDRVQAARRDDGTVLISALPSTFADVRAVCVNHLGADIKKRMDRFTSGASAWLTPDLLDEVCASDSVAGAWLSTRLREDELELEEQARLLYVAMTRAREVCILALEAKVSSGKVPELALDEARDLTPAVLRRILPEGGEPAAAFELIALDPFFHAGELHDADKQLLEQQGCSRSQSGMAEPPTAQPGAIEPSTPQLEQLCCSSCQSGAAEPTSRSTSPASPAFDAFTLAHPAPVDYRIVPAVRPPRQSHSYSSVAAALHAAGEDHAPALSRAADAVAAANDAALPASPAPGSRNLPSPFAPQAFDVVDACATPTTPSAAIPDDPTALGSAFHAAAQWLVETGEGHVPPARLDALARTWNISPAQRERLDAALERWERSAIRAEALAWPCVRAEVPFFTQGSDELTERFGPYVEGAIDLLCTDPADKRRALVIDYKTGGSPDEMPEQLQGKHALQARIYADVLNRAGYGRVLLKFVRVEVEDAAGEPQVVTYEL